MPKTNLFLNHIVEPMIFTTCSININDLVPAYTGIRPSLNETNDFVINEIFRNDKVMINVLGYNSPGLTASMGLGEFLNERLQDIQIN